MLPLYTPDDCEEHTRMEPGSWVDKPSPDLYLKYCTLFFDRSS